MKKHDNKNIVITGSTSSIPIQLIDGVSIHYFSGVATLGGDVTVVPTGTPVEGMGCVVIFNTTLTLASHHVYVNSVQIPDALAQVGFWALAVYSNGGWHVIYWKNVGGNGGGISINATGDYEITAGTITNAMVNTSAAIAYTKLSLAGAILNADINASAGIVYSKLSLAGSILNSDINASAAIAYTKLALTGSILNADINASAAIAYSKLNLTGAVTNADLAGSIDYSKLTLTGSVVNADISSVAAIALSKLAASTASMIPVFDASGFLISSGVAAAKLPLIATATSDLQAQITAIKANAVTNTIISGNVTIDAAHIQQKTIIDVTAGAVSIILPVANTLVANSSYTFMQMGSAGSAKIDLDGTNSFVDETGSSVITLTLGGAGKTITLVCDGASTYTIFGKS
jgi:hypothetical protein